MADSERGSGSLLIVDGDVLVRHAIADYLRQCGYIVVEASSTDEAVIVVEEPSLAIDTILCDADVPGSRNAFEFRALVTRQRPKVRVALAGSLETAANKAAELCEKGPALARPYDPQSVVDYVRRTVGQAKARSERSRG